MNWTETIIYRGFKTKFFKLELTLEQLKKVVAGEQYQQRSGSFREVDNLQVEPIGVLSAYIADCWYSFDLRGFTFKGEGKLNLKYKSAAPMEELISTLGENMFFDRKKLLCEDWLKANSEFLNNQIHLHFIGLSYEMFKNENLEGMAHSYCDD